MADWRRDVLRRLDAPVTPHNLRLLASWQRWEGGHTNNDARYNWLNTTMDAPGVVGSINDVGVKAFRSYQDGVNATALTILNGRYQDIIDGLRSGNPYQSDLTAGLSTWVSGSPTGNLAYAQKVMGGAGDPKGTPTPRAGAEPTRKGGSLPGLDMAPLRVAFSDDPEFLSLLEMIGQRNTGRRTGSRPSETGGPQTPMRVNGKGISIPVNYRSDRYHVTDRLGWGTKTAADILGAPGTPVSLQEDVTVVYYHPTGAQGGGSMLVRTASGREYWLGHITNGLKPGTRVRAGQALAVISPDHETPHVHVDRRG